jgi:arginyl-tRNA synthetase
MTTTSLAGRVDALLAEAFAALSLPAELAKSTVSGRPDLADRQCNAAIAMAKKLGRNPFDIATSIAEVLAPRPEFAEVSVARPGFLNMRLSAGFIAEMAQAQADDPDLCVARAATAEKILIDFGGPNVAKPLHVGHLRSLVIGESLRRILASVGHDVTSDVHLGDWGLQMGMLITELELRQPGLPYFDAAFGGPYPSEPPVSLSDLESMYPEAAAACKADPQRLEAARKATAELQGGRPGYRAVWKHFRDLSLSAQRKDFDELGAHFDLFDGESDADPLIAPMIADLRARGLAVESEGALVIHVAEPSSNQPTPPLLLAKGDGAALYATTDLATIRERVSRLGAQRILYVVDQRQQLHFEQVFKASRLAGYAGDGVKLEHVGFGTVNGKDGKPYKTREGGVMKLSDLLAEAIAKALEKLNSSDRTAQFSDGERAALARKVGIAAVKFADLSSVRTSGYVFDVDRLVSFEGKTGPYLQYACVRISSIIAVGVERGVDVSGAASGRFHPEHPAERELALECLRFPDAAAAAARTLGPNEIAEYAFELAKKLSKFYTECQVLEGVDADVRSSRLRLCDLTHKVLSKALWMLGVDVPARM